MNNDPTMTDRFAELKADTIASIEALTNEKANRGVMITATPFIIGTTSKTYLVAHHEPSRYSLGNRESAVQFSRRDAEAIAAELGIKGIAAVVLTKVAAIDRDIETLESLLKVIDSI